MPATPLDNYLRTQRKKAGLSQKEASRLVGLKNRFQFARYERFQSEPTLRVALACEQVFDVPISQLFAGVSDRVAKTTRTRVQAFERKLSRGGCECMASKVRYKLNWITKCLARLRHKLYAI